MNNTNESASSEACCSDEIKPGDMINHCPMAAKFEETLGSPKLNFSLKIIGIALLLLSLAIILKPVIIAWLMALVAMLMGIAILMISHHISRLRSPAE